MFFKYSKYRIIIYLFLFSFVFACNKRINDSEDTPDDSLVNRVGSESTFEIATWNIENFPLDAAYTVDNVKTIINDLDIDLIAVQEIASISSFNSLLSQLPGWEGELSDYTYSSGSYQKAGILYKSDMISLSNVHDLPINDYTEDGYSAFPRPPFYAYVEIRDNTGIKFDFNIIVLHLKAFSDEQSEARRRLACTLLKEYIDQQIAAGADSDFVVLGDWNDKLTDKRKDNVFNSFLDDSSHYTFLSESVVDKSSYIPISGLIDHILITVNAEDDYNGGKTEVLYLDNQFYHYLSQVSDHRPVAAVFKGFSIE